MIVENGIVYRLVKQPVATRVLALLAKTSRPLSYKEISRTLWIHRPNMIDAMKAMAAEGYVHILKSPRQAGLTRLTITPAGRASL